MKTIFTIILFSSLFISNGLAQTQVKNSIEQLLKTNIDPGQTRTITFDIFYSDSTDIINFKNELLLAHSPNVFDVTYHQIRKSFSFSYNEHINKEDLIGLFTKHNIVSLLDQKI